MNLEASKKTIRLSPTTGLNLFRECPRCFWLHYNKKVKRPRGIFPSLPGGMDIVLKIYFDQYRGELPPELEGNVVGHLMPDVELMNKWRNWRTGLDYHDKERDAVLFGALDECLVDGEFYIPLDYKTRGSAPKPGDSERYYQTQLDTYSLLLNANGYKTKDFAYLVYYYPEEAKRASIVKFSIEAIKVETNLKRIENTFRDAVESLKGPIPKHHSKCEYCSWINDRLGFE